MSRPDGGPAFPSHGSMGEVAQEGMTLRDYFAAHAPAEPQLWFEPTMPPEPEIESHYTLSGPDRDDWYSERADHDRDGCSPELLAFIERRKVQSKAYEDWHREARKQRLVQWPYAWADAMLAERAK